MDDFGPPAAHEHTDKWHGESAADLDDPDSFQSPVHPDDPPVSGEWAQAPCKTIVDTAIVDNLPTVPVKVKQNQRN
ncbi:hypothetical protein DPPLL_21460 [Desulfofustis limnaeus]|uniref:Uncharacterized protein n=1 Tax=Desulfofustis limnaeus TaxID=2740163 RepID=A0ABN6M4G8_9BACT|nr:hypothetical protein DPPLL_21460 [Desulfofustis limnaeus]